MGRRNKGALVSRTELKALETFCDSHSINVKAVEKNLLDVKAILDHHNIRFWLFFGTLLGVYRDGGLIPWDQDADLIYYMEDRPELLKCNQDFVNKGFLVQEPQGEWPGGTIVRYGEHSDFLPFELCGETRLHEPMDIRIEVDALENPDMLEFLGQLWRVPRNPEKWLAYYYGPNWRIPDIGLVVEKPLADHPIDFHYRLVAGWPKEVE